jgi:DNA-binding response OmpR family regulator
MYDNLKDKNVLYIEDELDVLENISHILGQFFSSFYKASTAESGLEIYNSYDIDILIVDIELPKMSGIDLIKIIREGDKNIPIVIISAYTKTDYLLESIELKLEKYIVKPFTTTKIHKLLEYLNGLYITDNMIELSSGVVINRDDMTLSFNGEVYNLTKKELSILEIMASKKYISYDEISDLWIEEIPTSNAIRSCIKQLRKKLPEGLIQNHSGFGYVLAQ